jgi:hypothetical protein
MRKRMTTFVLVSGLVLLLAGCAAPLRPALNDRFPDYCDLKQDDKAGTGYTKALFPCKLTHHEREKTP